ncbi:MAG: flagellar hook-length control protein FliK [Oscillospiraceae bacterium]|nr:flagellar hook-length control protein FliK [Oscillospiraceae bacterium]
MNVIGAVGVPLTASVGFTETTLLFTAYGTQDSPEAQDSPQEITFADCLQGLQVAQESTEIKNPQKPSESQVGAEAEFDDFKESRELKAPENAENDNIGEIVQSSDNQVETEFDKTVEIVAIGNDQADKSVLSNQDAIFDTNTVEEAFNAEGGENDSVAAMLDRMLFLFERVRVKAEAVGGVEKLTDADWRELLGGSFILFGYNVTEWQSVSVKGRFDEFVEDIIAIFSIYINYSKGEINESQKLEAIRAIVEKMANKAGTAGTETLKQAFDLEIWELICRFLETIDPTLNPREWSEWSEELERLNETKNVKRAETKGGEKTLIETIEMTELTGRVRTVQTVEEAVQSVGINAKAVKTVQKTEKVEYAEKESKSVKADVDKNADGGIKETKKIQNAQEMPTEKQAESPILPKTQRLQKAQAAQGEAILVNDEDESETGETKKVQNAVKAVQTAKQSGFEAKTDSKPLKAVEDEPIITGIAQGFVKVDKSAKHSEIPRMLHEGLTKDITDYEFNDMTTYKSTKTQFGANAEKKNDISFLQFKQAVLGRPAIVREIDFNRFGDTVETETVEPVIVTESDAIAVGDVGKTVKIEKSIEELKAIPNVTETETTAKTNSTDVQKNKQKNDSNAKLPNVLPNVQKNAIVENDIPQYANTISGQSVALQVSGAIVENLEKIIMQVTGFSEKAANASEASSIAKLDKVLQTAGINKSVEIARADKLEPIKTQITEFKMTLNPEHLGKVTVKLVTTDDSANGAGVKVAVQIIAASETVRDLLLARAGSVKVMIELGGVTVERYDVVTEQQAAIQANEVQQDFLDQNGNGGNKQNPSDGENNNSETVDAEQGEMSFAEIVESLF